MLAPGAHKISRASIASTSWLAPVSITIAVVAAYGNTFRVPFVFDDISAIVDNASLRAPWSLGKALTPPPLTSVGGRPLINLSLSLNHLIGGNDVSGYHAFNLAVHVLAAITVFAVIRRTLRQPATAAAFGPDADALSLATALLWSVHPLLTESVTYVVQRSESLCGLFYLCALYGLIRSASSNRPLRWWALAVGAGFLAALSKEMAATLPLVALLYDRTFLSGSFVQAWRVRRGLYLGLAACWALPVAELATGPSRLGESAGFGVHIGVMPYWATQAYAVVRYGKLALWPSPLVFDYGSFIAPANAQLAACVILAAAGAVATAVAVRKWPAAGFLGAWFFMVLSPTLLVPIATQTIAEHRMYLPLAGVACISVLGGYACIGRKALVLSAFAALACCVATHFRNAVYRSEVGLWEDTVTHWPGNARAHCSLGLALSGNPGSLQRAISEYDESLRIRPDYPEVHNNLGAALTMAHRVPQAVHEFEAALQARPSFAKAQENLDFLLGSLGQDPQAVAELKTATQSVPGDAFAHFFLGNALVGSGRVQEAEGEYIEALRCRPGFPEASNNLGMILFRTGDRVDGIARIEAAVRMDPGFVPALFSLGAAYLQSGRRTEALAAYQRVLEIRPGDPSALRMARLAGSSGSRP